MINPSPTSTTMNCSFTRSRRVAPSFSRREVEENIHTMEKRKSRSTMIHTTLSPSKRSANVQNEFFFFPAILQLSYRLLELFAPVLVVLEEVEACAARAEQHHVPAFGEVRGGFYGLFG